MQIKEENAKENVSFYARMFSKYFNQDLNAHKRNLLYTKKTSF